MEVHRSDMQKIGDALTSAYQHLHLRDASNANLHLAPTVRPSPLTSTVAAALERVQQLLAEDD